MKNDLKEIEDFLRNGKLPEKSLAQVQHKVWQKILIGQRQRRKLRVLSSLPPWTWALTSIILLLLCVIFMLLIK